MTIGTRPLSVLLVEDNVGDAVLLEAVLEGVAAPVSIDRVDCLSDAVDWLAVQLPDVVLLDLSLPDAVGMDGLRRLRELEPGVPIVVLTGLDDRAVADRALAAGAQDYLVKGPAVTGPLLERTLRYAVLRHNLLAELEQQRAAAEQSEASFRGIAASADGVIIADAAGTVRYLNPAAEALFGVEEEELVGHPLPFPLEPGDRREVEIGEGSGTTAEIVVAATEWEGRPRGAGVAARRARPAAAAGAAARRAADAAHRSAGGGGRPRLQQPADRPAGPPRSRPHAARRGPPGDPPPGRHR